MMVVKLNDKQHQLDEGTTLSEFIESLGIKPQGVAVAIDYRVVPKDEWDKTVLSDGLELMMIHAVSGG